MLTTEVAWREKELRDNKFTNPATKRRRVHLPPELREGKKRIVKTVRNLIPQTLDYHVFLHVLWSRSKMHVSMALWQRLDDRSFSLETKWAACLSHCKDIGNILSR